MNRDTGRELELGTAAVASLSLPVSRARSHGAKYTVTGGHRVTVLGTRHRSDSDSEVTVLVPGFNLLIWNPDHLA